MKELETWAVPRTNRLQTYYGSGCARSRAMWALSSATVLLVFSCFITAAQTVRVTSWSLRPGPETASEPTAKMLMQAAATLRQLDPDVILLQDVKDWQTCNRLAQALKPTEYKVGLCSSFRDADTGQPSGKQVAVLSKQKPYFFWSEAWRAPDGQRSFGGFAFIALQGSKGRLGFYCVMQAEDTATDSAAQQLLEHMKMVKQWEANAVQFVVVGGGSASPEKSPSMNKVAARLQEEGFADACFDLHREAGSAASAVPSKRDGVATYLLAERSAFGVNPQVTSISGQLLVSCELELDPAKVAAIWLTRAEELERRVSTPTAAAEPARRAIRYWWVALPVILLLLGFGLWPRGSRRALALPSHAPRQLLPGVQGGVSSYTVVLSPQSVTGSSEKDAPMATASHPVVHLDPPAIRTQSAHGGIPPNTVVDAAARTRLLADLGRWLKLKLVRGLIADRQQLLAVQHTAALKAKSVDQRLAKIEQQIESQTRDYEQRVEDLNRALLAAREENRELIRARIAEVKHEMAAVRTKVLARALERAESNEDV